VQHGASKSHITNPGDTSWSEKKTQLMHSLAAVVLRDNAEA